MKSIFICLSLITHLGLFAQDSCVIKISLNDCLNCYSSMKYFENYDENLQKTLLFPNISEAELNDYLGRVLKLTDVHDFFIVTSDSIYNSMNNSLTSELYSFEDNILLSTELLNRFQGFNTKRRIEIKLPDTLSISNNATIVNSEKYFFITDYLFGKFILIDKDDNRRVFIISGEDLTNKVNITKITGDSSAFDSYSKNIDRFRNVNADIIRLQPSRGSRGNMYSFLLVPEIRSINGYTGIAFNTGAIRFDDPENYSVFHFENESLPEGYFINPSSITSWNGKFYIQVEPLDVEIDDYYPIAEFKLSGNSLIFKGFPEYKMPFEYLPARKFEYLGKIVTFVDSYAFLQYSLSYFDFETDSTYQLPLDSVNLEFDFDPITSALKKLEANYKFCDAYVNSHDLQILFEMDNNYHLATIDRKGNRLVSNRQIKISDIPIKLGPFFYNNEKLFYLSNENDLIIEMTSFK